MQSTETIDRILRFIDEESLKPGDKLPAEVDFAQILGVSRPSIREAYARLASQGMVLKRHGSGTFVAEGQIFSNPYRTLGFWRLIEEAGYAPSLHETPSGEVALDEQMAGLLHLPAGERAHRFVWQFSANDVPAVFAEHFLSPKVDPDLVLGSTSRNVLKRIQPAIIGAARFDNWVTIDTAGEALARDMDLPPGTPLFQSTAVVTCAGDVVPLASRAWFNTKLITLHQTMQLQSEHFYN